MARVLGLGFTVGFLVCLSSCSSDGGSPTNGPPPPTPSIASLSTSVLAPGDTLSITGTNFAPAAADNRVVFNNALARPVPFFAREDSLVVVVPAWANSGNLYVTSRGVNSAPKTVEIVRGLGEPYVIGGNLNFTLKLPAPAGNERFILIPYSASTAGIGNYSYNASPDQASVFPAPQVVAGGARTGTVDFPTEFEAMIRREGLRHIETHIHERQPIKRSAAVAVPPDTTDFWVLTSTSAPLTFKRVTAARRYWVDTPSSSALIYADVNQPSGSFGQADYDAFGNQFDTQIFPTDTTYFGPPTDIDGNGRVIILFTPEVNRLTPPGTAQTSGFISGFFFSNDLASGVANSNGGEIFYAMVPDPNNEYGNTFSRGQITGIMPSTLAHEFEHMISFGYRFVTLGNGTSTAFAQVTWLEEGMAHIAENLNGFHASNEARSDLYLIDPGAVSIMGGDTLEQRGGIFLFLRYLGDQLGEDIFRSLLRSSCKGRACVQNVSGEDFFTSVANFLATVYLNGRPWVSDPKFHFKSPEVDVTVLWVEVRDVADGAMAGFVQNATADYYELGGIQSPAATVQVTGSLNGAIRLIVARIP